MKLIDTLYYDSLVNESILLNELPYLKKFNNRKKLARCKVDLSVSDDKSVGVLEFEYDTREYDESNDFDIDDYSNIDGIKETIVVFFEEDASVCDISGAFTLNPQAVTIIERNKFTIDEDFKTEKSKFKNNENNKQS
jgi:hypothetical protein